MWFRRDLRLRDHPALLAACAAGGGSGVVPLFVIDPALWDSAPASRRTYLAASLRELDRSLGGALVVRRGDPAEVLPAVVAEAGAGSVHVSADAAPFGRRRDAVVTAALAAQGVAWQPLGSPYAVAPGRVLTKAGTGFSVFTPFLRAWEAHGWRAPAGEPAADQRWLDLGGEPLPEPERATPQPVGEEAALIRWQEFGDRLLDYPEHRDRPDLEGTTRLSAALRFGEIHPRTILADLGDSPAAAKLRAELAWREFHADVLWRHPSAARSPLRPEYDGMRLDSPGPGYEAWCAGRTGFPIVDAGIRELLASGLMHNRVRMIVASFLIKDLHLDWRLGARFFLDHLIDGDLASNQLNWQWVAGCGADAAPYFRVFNPTTQGRKFDPAGAYVRRWVPELREAADPHEPGITAPSYPSPILDHAAERKEAIARWQELRAPSP